jgi:hypothetical protein
MHTDEPSLLNHILDVRKKISPEDGGVSTVIYCGTLKNESDMKEALSVHRQVDIIKGNYIVSKMV